MTGFTLDMCFTASEFIMLLLQR